jgi:hypothetical protein
MPELWNTADLLEVAYADETKPQDGFWLRDYPIVFTSEAQEIYFDKLPVRDRRLAPFVSPNVQGRVMRSRGRQVASFAPAYVKPKHVVDPSQAIARRAGEPIGLLGAQTLSLEERYDAKVAENMRTEREMIERRWDWLACQATTYGSVVISGEDYPTKTVDFGRDPSLTTTLLGGAQWDETTSDPLADIRASRKAAFELGRAPVNRFVFGTDAWNAFSAKPQVQDLLDKQKGGSASDYNRTGLTDGNPYEYMGQISGPNGAGRIDLWTYANDYEDPEDGLIKQFLNPADVVGIGGNLGGVRAFGAIMDKKAGLKALPIFPRMWEEDGDLTGTYTMTASAPLMVPTNPNNTFRIRVV